jgi:thiamine-phosphate pyrophosphorylase
VTRPAPDYSVYLVTDAAQCGARGVAETARLAVAGGARVVQLREKTLGTRAFVALAREVLAVLRGSGALVLINDRVDVALAAGAHGVHVGQGDMHPDDARRLLGPGAIVGLSVETMAQAGAAEGLDVDYYGVSPVFATPTKTDTGPAWGLEGLARLRAATARPLVAIGGIGPANAADVLRAGADGLAVVSAICRAPDPRRAATDLRTAADAAR